MKAVEVNYNRKKCIAEDLWLNYFNLYLYENKIISDKEFKKMTEKIAERKAKIYKTGSFKN